MLRRQQEKCKWASDDGVVREKYSQSKKQEDRKFTKDPRQASNTWMSETSQEYTQTELL